jgi:hypothetical protein
MRDDAMIVSGGSFVGLSAALRHLAEAVAWSKPCTTRESLAAPSGLEPCGLAS